MRFRVTAIPVAWCMYKGPGFVYVFFLKILYWLNSLAFALYTKMKKGRIRNYFRPRRTGQGNTKRNETRENVVVYMVIISHSFHHPYPWINYGTKNVNIEKESVSATETQMVSGWWPSVFFIQSSSKFVIASTYSHLPTLPGCRDHKSRVRVFVTRLHDSIIYVLQRGFLWASIGLISQLWN